MMSNIKNNVNDLTGINTYENHKFCRKSIISILPDCYNLLIILLRKCNEKNHFVDGTFLRKANNCHISEMYFRTFGF